MSKAAARAVASAFRALNGLLAHIWRDVVRRGYALALILVILWVSYRAVAYLVVQLMTPLTTPAQVAGVPKRMDEAVLHGRRPDWLGLSAVENPRSPLAHYHRFDTWLQTDTHNDCTRSGCHAALPHSQRKEVRAFLNMHATTIHCGVCHMKPEQTPESLVWYDVRDAQPSGPPALLATYAWLTEHAGAEKAAAMTEADQEYLATRLRAAADAADGDPSLRRLADHIHAVRAGSRAFADLVRIAGEAVQRSFRGSYGAKLALRDSKTGKPILGHPGTKEAVDEFLRRGAEAAGTVRESMLKAVHPQKREVALDCTACHRQEGSLLDFAKIGYPPARVKSLMEPAIFQMIEHISKGQPFYLPRVFSTEDTGATTQPATTPRPAVTTQPAMTTRPAPRP